MSRPPALMFLGTHSSAGKSLMVTAFCRILARRGVRVAPFKAQNMSNNAGVAADGGEMGRAQIVQAEAAGVEPHIDMNPVLLKPERDRRSQIVLNGKAVGHLDSRNWMDIKSRLWTEVQLAYDRLAARYDVVLLEGAGSPAEINLKAGDIVNLRMARHAEAPAVLVGDIDRGGVFAALAGTMLLLEPEEREQIHGFLVNKFRGDPCLLGNALEMLRELAYGVPTLGVIPFVPGLRIADEDAVALDRPAAAPGGEGDVRIGVVHLPHIANFDDFGPLSSEGGVHLFYVQRPEQLDGCDAVILPGTKATLADLTWLRRTGLDAAVVRAAERGSWVVGVCGGYQMLGERLSDPHGVESPLSGEVAGLGLLPVQTRFVASKQTHQARLRLPDGSEVCGYEIHAGESALGSDACAFGTVVERSGESVQVSDGARSGSGRVWGTYLHGLFGNDDFRRSWLRGLGWGGPDTDAAQLVHQDYDRLADAVEEATDMDRLMRIMGMD